MNSIYSLITDIQHLLKQRGWVTDETKANLGIEVARRFQEQFAHRSQTQSLRLSRMGPQCPCALWHSVHHPELEAPLPPWAEFKYLHGHTIEAEAIALAKAAGHSVTGEQDEVNVDGIVGHRDCVIDGCIVDVKSTNGRSFEKFKTGNSQGLDDWGYLSQLDGYLLGSRDDELVTVKDRAYLLAIHLELGHMVLYEHFLREDHIKRRIQAYKEVVLQADPPRCTCKTQQIGAAGNIGLAYPSTYNSFKFCCFPNLRTFIYSNGPVYLTKVLRKPDVQEVDKFGKIVYA